MSEHHPSLTIASKDKSIFINNQHSIKHLLIIKICNIYILSINSTPKPNDFAFGAIANIMMCLLQMRVSHSNN